MVKIVNNAVSSKQQQQIEIICKICRSRARIRIRHVTNGLCKFRFDRTTLYIITEEHHAHQPWRVAFQFCAAPPIHVLYSQKQNSVGISRQRIIYFGGPYHKDFAPKYATSLVLWKGRGREKEGELANYPCRRCCHI